MENIKTRIAEALEKRDMTASELSKKSGIGKGSISKYLKGTVIPKQNAINLIAQALDVTPSWLLGLDTEMKDVSPLTSARQKMRIDIKAKGLKRLGEHIRLLRESEGMSQETLAMKSGFAGRSAISAIEMGKNNISIDKLLDLAPALHTTPGSLMNVLVGVEENTLTSGLNAENLAKLKSYADFLRASQNEQGE